MSDVKIEDEDLYNILEVNPNSSTNDVNLTF